MFRNEVEALREVRNAGGHSNIITLYDAVSRQQTQLAVVELIDGQELDDSNLSVTPDQSRKIVLELADAMAFLHKNEIIYRDLKPDNAMVQSDGTAKLIDFNTAKGFDDDIEAQPSCPRCGVDLEVSDYVCDNCGKNLQGESLDTKIGSSQRSIYKPPEATEDLAHFRQGPWSDVYSLGKLLYYLLDENDTVVPKHGARPQEFATDLDPSQEYLSDIVVRATKENYRERYRNASVLKRVLENEDPEPPAQARLKHLQTDREYWISPGDTIGRKNPSGPPATITIDDPGSRHISSVQLAFTLNDDEWVLIDKSLNGTYVEQGNGWQRVLCENGQKRLKKNGTDPTDRYDNIPPQELVLEDGATVSLVHPTYNVTFEFHTVS
jgi:protein kinase/serine/threonine-protein kinase